MDINKLTITFDRLSESGEREEYHYKYKGNNTDKSGEIVLYISNLFSSGRSWKWNNHPKKADDFLYDCAVILASKKAKADIFDHSEYDISSFLRRDSDSITQEYILQALNL